MDTNNTNNSINSVYASDFVNIVEGPHKGIFKIFFAYPSRALINSLIKTKIIQGGTATDDYKTLQFKANTVTTLIKNKTTAFAAQMTSSLATQLNYLITAESHTIIGYAPENIIVINDQTFAFLDSELVADIDPVGKEMATISCPFKVTDFFASPEMLRIMELPSQVHYKTSYFSLGCLLLYALTGGSEDFYKEYLTRRSFILNQLHFKNTKLYWLLSRCLVEEPEKRSILFI